MQLCPLIASVLLLQTFSEVTDRSMEQAQARQPCLQTAASGRLRLLVAAALDVLAGSPR